MQAIQTVMKQLEGVSEDKINIIIVPPNTGTHMTKRKEPQPPIQGVSLKRVHDINWGILTDREVSVFHQILQGHENKEIAECLGISEKTVKNHVSSILLKMKVKNRTEAVVLAFKTAYVEIV
ncbi:helix-turn-helix domain-containing protein [Brevibacillus reuszeri]|uniref:helix-turn-helix domain-containing protein n=1 Tax=Brevibacillus reuszeri TaxID=54915 RepID=UPI000CCBEB1B